MKIAFRIDGGAAQLRNSPHLDFLAVELGEEMVMPSVGLAACSNGVVRVSSRMLSASCAVEVQILLPLTM